MGDFAKAFGDFVKIFGDFMNAFAECVKTPDSPVILCRNKCFPFDLGLKFGRTTLDVEAGGCVRHLD